MVVGDSQATTIAAISTPQGVGGLGVVRISGKESLNIAEKIFKPVNKNIKLSEMQGYTARYGQIFDNGRFVDDAVLLYFKEPMSYTGENVVEISCHGGMYVTRKVLRLILDFGAKLAEPGEFTKRAFLNGKIDLLQAEAVNDIINSETAYANNLALSQKEGVYHSKILELKQNLSDILAKVSVVSDYPEDFESFSISDFQKAVSDVKAKVFNFIRSYDSGKMIKNGVKAVIVGAPNVGKSELMNYLSGYDKSIVTEFSGTTRDIVQEKVLFCGIPFFISDTAGIHETSDFVESIGIEKAKKEINSADLVFYVFDNSRKVFEEELNFFKSLETENLICIINKIDLPKKINENCLGSIEKVRISAKNHYGLENLESAITKTLELNKIEVQGELMTNERHYRILKNIEEKLAEVEAALSSEMFLDAITVMLREILDELFRLTGENVDDAIVDEIFSKFCVGK